MGENSIEKEILLAFKAELGESFTANVQKTMMGGEVSYKVEIPKYPVAFFYIPTQGRTPVDFAQLMAKKIKSDPRYVEIVA